jgi:hypothetical protein
VEVGVEFLVPAVQDGNKAQLAVHVIFTKGQKGFGCRGKQAVEHRCFIVQNSGVQFMRQGEDDMEVAGRQDLVFSFFKPTFSWHVLAFGAVPVPAGMVANAGQPAVVASLDMPAQASGAAV